MQRTKFLGISMAERSHRRALVICVYSFLVALVAARGLIHHRSPLPESGFFGGINTVLILVFTGISRLAFGALVRQSTFPLPGDNPNPWQYVSIRRPVPYMGPGDPDERELAVRYRAYYHAFRFVAFYSVLLWPVFVILNESPRSISVSLAATLMFPLIVMALTLPQAVVLWTEPDVAVDDGELVAAR